MLVENPERMDSFLGLRVCFGNCGGVDVRDAHGSVLKEGY
jgi:hypothetical protein